MLRKILTIIVLASVVMGCNTPAASLEGSQAAQQAAAPAQSAPPSVQPVEPSETAQVEASPTAAAPTAAPAQIRPTSIPAEPTSAPTSAPAVVGPDQFPAGVSPLTGLPVQNGDTLDYAPALVSITNFPPTARPQAGLSFSPFVFEMYIGEGMTRFLALFHGDYPVKSENNDAVALDDDKVGPVRSGRLPYESIRQLYNGFLVMASASPNVKSSLTGFTNVWGTDTSDINSAMIPATKLEEVASSNDARLKEGALSGLQFSQNEPENGKPANSVWIPFSYLNQVIWRYDQASESYHRYQDNADGQTFIQATDRLNGEPLTYENVVILFANHTARKTTLINIDLMYIDKMPALLFRDGKMYEIFWTTANEEYEKTTGRVRPIRFIDAEGNPFPLKTGQTWVEVVQAFTPYNETADSESYMELKRTVRPGSGSWAIHFFPTLADQ